MRRAARTFLKAGVAPLIAVVSDDPRFVDALAGLSVSIYENPEPDRGISSSIAIGVRALPATTDAALIGVGDQPYLTAEALEELVRAFEPGRIIVPRFGDHRGNPPVFDRRFFQDLMALEGDEGGQRVIAAYPDSVTEVRLSARLGDDIDRPEEWPR